MNTTTDDFKIKALVRDKDALLLIGMSAVLALAILLGLALLSDAQWNRLVERSKLLWAAGLAIVPALVAIYSRFRLREAAVRSLGAATQPTTTTEPAGNLPAGVTKAGK